MFQNFGKKTRPGMITAQQSSIWNANFVKLVVWGEISTQGGFCPLEFFCIFERMKSKNKKKKKKRGPKCRKKNPSEDEKRSAGSDLECYFYKTSCLGGNIHSGWILPPLEFFVFRKGRYPPIPKIKKKGKKGPKKSRKKNPYDDDYCSSDYDLKCDF